VGRLGRPGCRPTPSLAAEAGHSLIAVLDTSGISGLAPVDDRRRARLRALRASADDIVVPTAVLAEGTLTGHPGRDHHVRQLLSLVAITDVDEDLGYAAGRLRHEAIRRGADRPPSGVDAIVVALADRRARRGDVQIVTSDPVDLGLLASFGEHAARIFIKRI
jgi:predicted nucleic acid-binding protein